MISVGRRARPVELLVLTGKKHLTKKEAAARRQAEGALRPPSAGKQLYAPRWLSKAAQKEWRRVVALMADLGVLTEVDTNTLAVYCDAAVRYAEAAKQVEEQGAVIETEHGPRQNPAVLVAEKYWRIMNKAAATLGLDPASRASLARAKAAEQQKDDFDKLFGTGSGR